jgi:glycosyltransferase involved in cell wall biosynthesis
VPSNDAPLLIDATRLVWRRWAGRRATGIDRVCLAYLRHFSGRAQAVVHHRHLRRILDRDSSRDLFEMLCDPPERFRRALVSGALRRLGGRSCRGDGRLYLNIGHTGLDSEGFRNWVGASGVRPVYFVHDLIPITHPDYCRAGEAERHKRRMRTVLETGCGIIGNSEATLDELAAFAAGERLPCPPMIAAWLGSTPLQPPPRAPTPDRPYFVVLGTIEARKNHMLLLRIWSKLAERFGEAAPRLVIIGQRGWEADEVFAILNEAEELRGHVIELANCADEEAARQLAGARALLFPSKAEGFGLPLVEGLGMGVPVIASDLPVFREVGQGVPTLIDSCDEDAWLAAIVDFARPESAERSEQLQRLKRFRVPDWDSHFRIVEHWLRSRGQVQGAPSSTRPGS